MIPPSSPCAGIIVLFLFICGSFVGLFFTSAANDFLLPGLRDFHGVYRHEAPLVDLRLLCIGDSITVGVQSSDGNGYRLDLENLLEDGGTKVDFIGSQKSGEHNPNNREEGYGFFRISWILKKLEEDNILAQQPNLVLIHAGTNDNDIELLDGTPSQPVEKYTDTPKRLGALLDYLLCHVPDAVVIVAKVIQNKYHPEETELFNARVPQVVAERSAQGYKVHMVDMSAIGGDELADWLHPTDDGYRDMALKWYAAIEDVPRAWWSPPNTALPVSGTRTNDACALAATSVVPLPNRTVTDTATSASSTAQTASTMLTSIRERETSLSR